MLPEETPSALPEPVPPKREPVGPDYHVKDDKSHTGLIVAIIIVLLLVVAGAAAWHYKFHKKTKAPTVTQNMSTVESQVKSSTKNYSSPNFYLSFNYPADWKITDNGGGQMSALSPAIKLKDANGSSVDSEIAMLIRQNTQNFNEFDQGNATAAVASQRITYANPTQTQRASTYVSFLTYATSGNDSLDGIYVTGDNGYQVGQAIPLVDVKEEDPVISILFYRCVNSDCSGKTVPLSISPSSWQDAGFSGPLLKMLESLSIT